MSIAKNKEMREKVRKERIKFIMDNIGCNEEEASLIVNLKLETVQEAQDLIAFDKTTDKDTKHDEAIRKAQSAAKAVTKAKKKGVQDDEVEKLAEIIKSNLVDKEFQNKDLAPFLTELGLTARQTPSRLKRLAEIGVLKDLGGSPKKYKLS